MKIVPINNNPQNNNSFKAHWYCTYQSDFYKLGVDCFNSGKGENFFNAVKRVFEISPKSVLKFENKEAFLSERFLSIANLKRKCCDGTPKGLAQYTHTEQVIDNSLRFIEEIAENKSSKEVLFGESIQNPISVDYIETSTAEEFMEKNIKQFCWGKTFLK